MKRQFSIKQRLKSMAVTDLGMFQTKGLKEDIDKMSDDERLINACKILEKQPRHRTNFDILLLLKLTEKNPFFKEVSIGFYQENCDSNTHQMICKQMYYLEGTKDQILFDIGQKGSQFYIILKGTVSVLIKIGQQLGLQEVNQLGEGKYFGELALMGDNALRSATIKLKTDCIFACLDKEQYQSILMVKQYQELRENVLMFLQIPYFNAWGERDLIRIMYRRTPKTYQYNQAVYNQGDGSESGVFLIKTGIFKVQVEKKYTREDLDQGELYKQLKSPLQKNNTVHKTIELSILPSGHSFGEEETYYGLPRQSTVRCDSQEGQVYILSRSDLRRRVFWDRALVSNLETHIKLRQKHQAKMIEYQDNLIISAEKEIKSFKSKKYIQEQELIITQSSKNINMSENTYSITNKDLKSHDTQNISSRQDKVIRLEFVQSERPSVQRILLSPKSLNSVRLSDSQYFIQGSLSRKQTQHQSEKKRKLTQHHSEQKIHSTIQSEVKNTTQSGFRADYQTKELIEDIIQRMNDKLNGRIIKQSQFMDEMHSRPYPMSKFNSNEHPLLKSKQKSVGPTIKHIFNSSIQCKRIKTLQSLNLSYI